MSSEPIDIEVRDKVSTTVRDKLLNIAAAALEGANSVDKLNAMLDKIDSSSVAKLTKAQSDLEKQTAKNNISYLAQETALNKAIAAETAAETAAQKLTTASLQSEAAQLKAAAAATKTAQASAQAATAVNAFGETEADVAARLNGVAQAGAALAKQQQSISITAAQATNAEAGLARATTANGAAAAGAATRYSSYMSALNTLGKTGGANAAAAGLKDTAAAADKAALANAGVTRELIVLGHEAISGNFSRIPGSMLVLAERVNGVGAALSALVGFLGPVGTVLAILTAAGAALAAVLGLADNANKKLQNGLSITGFISGLTAASLKDLAKNVADVNDISISSAKDIVSQLALSGQFTKEQVSQLATATVGLERSTSESSDKIIKSFDELAKSPLAYAENLARTTDIIKPALLAQLDQLDKQGQKTKEVELISRALFDYFNGTARESLTGVSGFWHMLGTEISDAGSKLKEFATLDVFSPTQQQQLDAAVNKFNILQTLQNAARSVGGNGLANLLQGGIDTQQNTIDGIQAEAQALSDKAKATSEARAQDIAANLALKEASTAYDGARGNVEKMNNELTKFRTNLKTIADDPRLANTPQATSLFDNAAAIEASIRRKYAPPKTAATPDENREAILAKQTAALEKQLVAVDQLNGAREAAQKLQEIDDKLATHTKDGRLAPLQALDDEEKNRITILLDQIAVAKRVEAAQESIYANVAAPLRTLNDGEEAITNLVKNYTITAEQAAQAQRALNFAYSAATDPLFQFNRTLKDQNDLLDANLGVKERAARQAVQQINATLAPQGKSLSSDQAATVERENLALQKRNQYQSEYDRLVAANQGQAENLVTQLNALNSAYAKGAISQNQYAQGFVQIGLQMNQLLLDKGAGFANFENVALGAIGKIVAGYKNAMAGLSETFGNFFTQLEDGFANSIGKAIVYGGSLKDSLLDVARQGVSALISSLVKLGIQYVVNAGLGTTIAATALAATTAASVAAATTTAIAWAPAAAAVSLASFGANSIPASEGIVATYALTDVLSSLGAFEQGGYTGNVGTSQIAGVVHGQEFVVNAQATRNNLGALQAMNSGASGSSPAAKVVIEDHTSGGVNFQSVQGMTTGEVRLIARDEAKAEVQRSAGRVVSGELNNPNSDMSKSVARNTSAQRQR